MLSSGYTNDINDSGSVEEEEYSHPTAPSSLVPETPQSSLEGSDLVLMNNSSTSMHFKAQELENYLVPPESEPLESFELELFHTLLMLRVWMAQAYSSNLRRAISSSLEPEHRFQAAIRTQCLPVHSA